MRIVVFSTKPYDERFLRAAAEGTGIEWHFLEARLKEKTAPLARGYDGVCAFVNDELGAPVLSALREGGTRIVALRCAGFNNVDVPQAHELGLCVCRVPAYSPYAVAEHAVGLMLALNRRIHRAHARVREGNFQLEGLLGFDMHGRTAGVVGTGKIGVIVARILSGFGCEILAHDPNASADIESLGGRYVGLPELFAASDIVTLHCPLLPATRHMINAESIAQMKPGVLLVNTSRGALVDTAAVIEGLKSGRIGHLGLDVYEEEADLFFEDLSGEVLQDDVFARLLTFPNVIVTGHQAYFTEDALHNIAETTVENLLAFERSGECRNSVFPDRVRTHKSGS